MRYILVILALISGAALSEEGCDYSQEYQQEKLARLADSHDGSELDLDRRVVSWPLENGAKIIYGYGGCTHLGHSVTLVQHLDEIPSEKEALNKAQALANEFWDKSDAEHLKTSLQSKRYTIEKVGLETYYVIEHPDLIEFNVIFEFQHNESRITISSVRNF